MNPREGLPSVGSPVSEQSGFEVLYFQWLCEKWVVAKVKHAETEVHAGTEVGVHSAELIGNQRLALQC